MEYVICKFYVWNNENRFNEIQKFIFHQRFSNDVCKVKLAMHMRQQEFFFIKQIANKKQFHINVFLFIFFCWRLYEIYCSLVIYLHYCFAALRLWKNTPSRCIRSNQTMFLTASVIATNSIFHHRQAVALFFESTPVNVSLVCHDYLTANRDPVVTNSHEVGIRINYKIIQLTRDES